MNLVQPKMLKLNRNEWNRIFFSFTCEGDDLILSGMRLNGLSNTVKSVFSPEAFGCLTKTV